MAYLLNQLPTPETMRRLVLVKDCGIVWVDGRWQTCHFHFSAFSKPLAFSAFSKPLALVCGAKLTRAKLQALKTLKNDMLVIFRLLERSHNPCLVPVSSSFLKWAI